MKQGYIGLLPTTAAGGLTAAEGLPARLAALIALEDDMMIR
jgi:protein involved in ribonucleotide reduction